MKLGEEILIEINLGASICSQLKILYFPDVQWVKCYNDVAKKLTHLKKISEKLYADKTKIDVLKELNKYSANDILELF